MRASHLLAALLSLFGPGVAGTSADAALLVNGDAVSPAELQWFAQRERTEVIKLCAAKYGMDYGLGFWTRDIRGTTPRLLLQQKAIARATREKVEQILFRELGVIPDISYGAFLDALERTNRERREAVQQGRMVYGPVNFTAEQFYDHRMATMRIRAKELLARSRLAATETELETSFKAARERYRSPALSSWQFVVVPAGPVAPAPQGAPETIENVTEERLGEILGNVEFSRALAKLRAGESARLKRTDGGTLLAKCVARKPGELRSFAEVRPSVAARWLDERYERLIAALAAGAKVQLNPPSFDLTSVE